MAAVGVEAQISEALLQRLAALTLSPVLLVAYPDVPFPKAGQEKPDMYLEAHQLRAETKGIGISAWNDHPGLFQIDVVRKKNIDGIVGATEVADKVADWFKRGTILTNGSTRVRIDEPPSIANSVPDGSYSRTPVSVRYRVFSR